MSGGLGVHIPKYIVPIWKLHQLRYSVVKEFRKLYQFAENAEEVEVVRDRNGAEVSVSRFSWGDKRIGTDAEPPADLADYISQERPPECACKIRKCKSGCMAKTDHNIVKGYKSPDWLSESEAEWEKCRYFNQRYFFNEMLEKKGKLEEKASRIYERWQKNHA